MNLLMTGELAAAYQSGSQRARVVTEAWGEHNLYCPNCASTKLNRLAHNTKASDFSCAACQSWYQLKGQKTRIGNYIMDGAYETMMNAIRNDATPNFYFMQYELATWSIKNLLLVPCFAFSPSAIIKRKPLSKTARRAGWVGCNISLLSIPKDARIQLISDGAISPPAKVRSQYERLRPLKEIGIKSRGWTLDVLAVVRSLNKPQFTNAEIYGFVRHFETLYPGNRHIKDKLRQQLQVLRDRGFLTQAERGIWRAS